MTVTQAQQRVTKAGSAERPFRVSRSLIALRTLSPWPRTASLLQLAAISATLFGTSLTLVLGSIDTAAAMSTSSQRPELTVTDQTPPGAGPLMPGGTTTQIFSVSAAIDVVYDVRVSINGSQTFSELTARIESAVTGENLYQGPLSTAGLDDRTLLGKDAEELAIHVTLPVTAGNESSGETVRVAWSFRAAPIGAP